MNFYIAPHELHKDILKSERASNKFLNIKIYTKEDLGKLVNCSLSNEALVYLMKTKNYTYEESYMYLEFIPYINEKCQGERFEFLKALKKELEENDFVSSPVIDKYFEGKEVTVIGYSENDIELKQILNKCGLSYKFKKPASKENPNFSYFSFSKIEEEVIYVLNEIAILLSEGIDINKIKIFCRDKTFFYYLNKFDKEFGYKVCCHENSSLVDGGLFTAFNKLYKDNKDIESTLNALIEMMTGDEEMFDDFSSLVKEQIIDGFSFEQQYDYLTHSLSKLKKPTTHFKNVVDVISNPIFCEDYHIFVIGFSQGTYPKVYKDDKYLNANQLLVINRLNGNLKTSIDEELLSDFFMSNNSFYFSFHDKDLDGSRVISPLASKLSMEKCHRFIDKDFYSENVAKLYFASLKDNEHFYKEKSLDYYRLKDVVRLPYLDYYSGIKGNIKRFDADSYVDMSTTKLTTYSECPYKYYLSNVLKLDSDFDNFNINLGNFSHSILEHCFNENFNFDKVFDEKLNNYQFSNGELFILKSYIKGQLYSAINVIKARHLVFGKPEHEEEKKIKIFLDKNTSITGTIDAFYYKKNEWIMCIDYKTGNKAFDDYKIPYGIDTQLPTYALLAKSIDEFEDCKIAGLFINNIISNSFSDSSNESEVPDYLKLRGKANVSNDLFLNIDASVILSGKSDYVYSLAIKKQGGLKESKTIGTDSELNDYITTVKNIYIEMANSLRNNKFDIAPIEFEGKAMTCPCGHCSFKDICYVREHQKRIIVQEDSSNGEN